MIRHHSNQIALDPIQGARTLHDRCLINSDVAMVHGLARGRWLPSYIAVTVCSEESTTTRLMPKLCNRYRRLRLDRDDQVLRDYEDPPFGEREDVARRHGSASVASLRVRVHCARHSGAAKSSCLAASTSRG